MTQVTRDFDINPRKEDKLLRYSGHDSMILASCTCVGSSFLPHNILCNPTLQPAPPSNRQQRTEARQHRVTGIRRIRDGTWDWHLTSSVCSCHGKEGKRGVWFLEIASQILCRDCKFSFCHRILAENVQVFIWRFIFNKLRTRSNVTWNCLS